MPVIQHQWLVKKIVPKEVEGAFYVAELTRIRCKVGKVHSYFLFYALMLSEIRNYIRSLVKGGHLYINQTKLIPIPLPPLPEQRAIAHVLRTVQEAKEATERVIAALRELKKSLMRYLFTYGPVPVDQTDRVALQETEIGPLPAHWQVVRFEDTVIKRKIKVVKVKQQEYCQSGRFPIVDQGQHLIAGYWDNEDDVYKGPLPVIVFGDHTRIFKYVDFPFVCGADGTKILVPNVERYFPRFLYYALLTLKIPSRGYNRHFRLLREQLLPLPPLSEQREIARLLQAVDRKIEAEEARKQALEALFKSLLHHLMTAKVRVKGLIPQKGGNDDG